jgi:RNA polymerase sigma factor (sigma-70 family)
MENSGDTIRLAIEKVRAGDDDGLRVIWDRYFPQVLRLAERRLAGQRKRVADEEDIAVSVMERFFRAAQAGRFPDLQDSDGIWRLLARMTCAKVIDHVRRNTVRPVLGESALHNPPGLPRPLESLASDDPSPALLAVLEDQVEYLLGKLPQKYRAIALKKLECLTVEEIAEQCGVHTSTVERRLRIIRGFWAREFGDAN